jgi:hypothetical protein
MIDHLTSALLAAARLDDAAAVEHLESLLGARGYGARKLLREFPVTLPVFLADRPSLRASVERAASPDEASAAPSKAGHAVALAIRAQSEARPFDTLARIEAMGYPHLADLARRAWSKLPAGSFADDEAEEAVGPFPSPAVSSHAATFGARLASPPFSFDDLPPDVERAAGILGGWIDPAAEARRDVAAKARAMMAAGDLAGAVGVLVASYDANGSPVEGT